MRLNRIRSLGFFNRETKDWKTTTNKKKQKETKRNNLFAGKDGKKRCFTRTEDW